MTMTPEAAKNWAEKMKEPVKNHPIPPEELERLRQMGIEFRKD